MLRGEQTSRTINQLVLALASTGRDPAQHRELLPVLLEAFDQERARLYVDALSQAIMHVPHSALERIDQPNRHTKPPRHLWLMKGTNLGLGIAAPTARTKHPRGFRRETYQLADIQVASRRSWDEKHRGGSVGFFCDRLRLHLISY